MIDRRDVGVAHVRAHRFARRRTDEVLTRGSVHTGAVRRPSVARQTVLSHLTALVVLVGFGVASLVDPQPRWRDAEVLLESGTGAVFLQRDGVLAPVLNLTSAQLAATDPTRIGPLTVSADDIAAARRAPTIGIAGAPDRVPTADRLAAGGWSLCDTSDGNGGVITTVIIGSDPPGVDLGDDLAVLTEVAPRQPGAAGSGGPAELLWAGGRLAIDRSDLASRRALGLSEVTARPVGAVWAAALPAADPVAVTLPRGTGGALGVARVIDATGNPVPVGSVLRVSASDGADALYLLHDDGVEQVDPLLADLLRYRTGARLVPLEPAAIAALPFATARTVVAGALPSRAPRVLGVAETPTVCATWRAEVGTWRISVDASAGDPSAAGVAGAGGGRADRVQIPPGTGALVTTAPSTAGADDGGLVFVGDTGVAYPITRDAAVRLGLTTDEAAVPVVPAALVEALVPGPALDRDAAGQTWIFQPVAASWPVGPTVASGDGS